MTASLFLWGTFGIVTDRENERLRRIARKVDHLVFRIPPSADLKCDRFPFFVTRTMPVLPAYQDKPCCPENRKPRAIFSPGR